VKEVIPIPWWPGILTQLIDAMKELLEGGLSIVCDISIGGSSKSKSKPGQSLSLFLSSNWIESLLANVALMEIIKLPPPWLRESRHVYCTMMITKIMIPTCPVSVSQGQQSGAGLHSDPIDKLKLKYWILYIEVAFGITKNIVPFLAKGKPRYNAVFCL
jgi:hypothetical protein